MKQFLKGLYRFTTQLALALALLGFSAFHLPAQESTDPTASQIPNHELQIPAEKAPPEYKNSSPALLISGLIGTIGGTILCIYAAPYRSSYTAASDAWSANPNGTNLAARDAAGIQYLAPFIGGIALSATGIILTIAGISNGMGGESYQPIIPAVKKDDTLSAGLYLIVQPTSLAIAIR